MQHSSHHTCARRCHRCILATRSHFLAALLEQPLSLPTAVSSHPNTCVCRCHRCILAARSDFLAALLEQPLRPRESAMTQAALSQHELQPRSPGSFWHNAYLPSEVGSCCICLEAKG